MSDTARSPRRRPSGRSTRKPQLLVGGLLLLVIALVAYLLAHLVADRTDDAEGLPRTGTLSAVPMAEPGASRAPMVVVQFSQAEPESRVLLEQKRDDNWQRVATTRLPASRSVTFPLADDMANETGPLRAVVVGRDGVRRAVTNAAVLPRWRIAFADEFDGARLDPARWTHRQVGEYNEEGSRTCSTSDPSAAEVADGRLRLHVALDPRRAGERCTSKEGDFRYYLNGHVGTEDRFQFTYGYAAARIRFPRGRGQHGAFWLQRDGDVAANPGAREGGAEIDVVEFFGEGFARGGLAAFVHFVDTDGREHKVGGLQPGASRALAPGDSFWRRFHVFSVEWAPRHYVFYVDGNEVFRTRRGVSGVPQFAVLSLLTSDWELPQLDESTLPTTMEVDWVRVWQEEGPGAESR